MKRLLALSALLGSALALNAAAQMPDAPGAPSAPAAAATAPAGPTKIAVIAFQAAVSKTNEFQRNFADLQKKYDPKRQQLKTLSDEIDASTKQLQAQAATLSDAERASRAKAIDDRKKQLDRQAEDAQNDVQQEMQQVYSGTASKVYDVLSAYAQQNGYTLVLDVAGQQTPILYALPTTNVTQAIVDAYNLKSGVPPPAPVPASASTPSAAPHRPAAPKAPQR
jgi:outer membrane protein